MEGTDGFGDPTKIIVAVNESSLKGYPHPSISSRSAFEWTLSKLVRSNLSGFKFYFVHVQIPDEDGTCQFLFVSTQFQFLLIIVVSICQQTEFYSLLNFLFVLAMLVK
jgi:hypothetical protein